MSGRTVQDPAAGDDSAIGVYLASIGMLLTAGSLTNVQTSGEQHVSPVPQDIAGASASTV